MDEKKHLYGIDLLRGIAAFGIVGCHLALTPRTIMGSAITHFCDMNVAVFGVIAGYFTHAIAAAGAGGDISRRLKRLLPIYAIWTVIFLIASFIFKVAAHDSLSQYTEASFWLNAAFFGGSSTHLWFIAVLVYTQVFALILLHIKVPRGIDWLLGFVGIALSVSIPNWWGCYFFRLFGFVWLGIAARGISWGGCKVYGILTCFALLAHIGLSGIVPGFLRDMLVALPLVMFAVRLPLGGGYIICPRTLFGRNKYGCLFGTSALHEVRLCSYHATLPSTLFGRGRSCRLDTLLDGSPYFRGTCNAGVLA